MTKELSLKQVINLNSEDFYKWRDTNVLSFNVLLPYLKALPNTTPVYVKNSNGEYTDEFYLFTETLDTRSSVSTSFDDEYKTKQTVKTVRGAINQVNFKHSLNIFNDKGEYTSHSDIIFKNGGLYLIGKRPFYKYSELRFQKEY